VITADAPYDWTGFYIGLHAGGGWGRGSVIGDPLPSPVTYGFVQQNIPVNGSGGVAGGQVGYNWQVSPAFLLGVEADASWSGIRGTGAVGPIQSIPPGAVYVPGSIASASRNIDWLGTVRGRVGYTSGRFLGYATGGIAWAGVKDAADEAFLTGVNNPGSSSSTKTGWVVGGGLEYAVTNNWILRGEYLHYDLTGDSFIGARVPVLPTFGVLYTYDRTRLDVVRVGIDYKFGGPVVAKY
jgi:outer membrane immunogenic protein